MKAKVKLFLLALVLMLSCTSWATLLGAAFGGVEGAVTGALIDSGYY